MELTKMEFPMPTAALYHGTMTEFHGDAKVWGPMDDGRYRIWINVDVVLYSRNRESFTVND